MIMTQSIRDAPGSHVAEGEWQACLDGEVDPGSTLRYMYTVRGSDGSSTGVAE